MNAPALAPPLRAPVPLPSAPSPARWSRRHKAGIASTEAMIAMLSNWRHSGFQVFCGNRLGQISVLLAQAIAAALALMPAAVLAAPDPFDRPCPFFYGLTVDQCLKLAPPLILLLSVAVSVVALRVTVVVSRAAWQSARADTFRQLRSTFFQFRKDLPHRAFCPVSMPTKGSVEFERMVQYWQYAFDEWFVTMKLNAKRYGQLWDLYYKQAISTTAVNEFMLVALFEAFTAVEGWNNPADREFCDVVFAYAPEIKKRKAVVEATKANIEVPKHFGLEQFQPGPTSPPTHVPPARGSSAGR